MAPVATAPATATRSLPVGLIVPPALQALPLADLAAWAAGAGFDAVDAVDADAHHDAETVAALGGHGLRLGPMRIRASLADSDPAARAAAGYAGWLVAESEFGDGWRGATEPAETARRQFEGLRAVLAGAGPADTG